MITAIVFTYWPEEENYIQVCLETVKWADEIVVVDNGATERTLEIVKKYTNEIYKDPSTNFAARHNLAKEKAAGDWILYIDADERISAALKKEIQQTLKAPNYDAYELNRVNYYLGKKVRFGDRNPDFVARLFKKEKLKGWTGEIHESSRVSGTTGKLNSPLYHLTHRDIFSMMQKTINFAQHEANLRYKVGHPPVVGWRLLRVFLTEFCNRLIKYQGFRQGTEGWIDGIFQAFSMFIVYARLWEKQRHPSLKESYERIDREIIEGKI